MKTVTVTIASHFCHKCKSVFYTPPNRDPKACPYCGFIGCHEPIEEGQATFEREEAD